MAGGNRGDIVFPEVRRSELACNWIPTNGDQNATKSEFHTECQAGSLGVQRGLGLGWVLPHPLSLGVWFTRNRQEVLPWL